MIRQRLPNRRASTSFMFELAGLHYSCTFSCFADGRLAEVFINNHKAGSAADANARDAAVAASLALQYGCPPAVLTGALLRNANGSAASPLGAALDHILSEFPALQRGGQPKA